MGQAAILRGRNRFWVNPAGDQNRTTRVAVKASRNNLDAAEDANLTDQIALATVAPTARRSRARRERSWGAARARCSEPGGHLPLRGR